MKFVCQRDYPHWLYVTRTGLEEAEQEIGKSTSVSTSGCGLCAAVMMADQLIPNCDFELRDAIDLSYELKANHRFGTDYAIYAPVLAERLGLHHEVSNDIADVHRCLKSGGSVIVLVQGKHDGKLGLFSGSGHYINVIGYEADGRFVILNPSHEPGKYDVPDRRGRVELKYDYLVLCDEKNLVEEIHQNLPPYYLFWRK